MLAPLISAIHPQVVLMEPLTAMIRTPAPQTSAILPQDAPMALLIAMTEMLAQRMDAQITSVLILLSIATTMMHVP